MEKILKLMALTEPTTETIAETIPEATETMMTELETLQQINSNIVTIGNIQNLILGALIIIILYGMYKAAVKFFSMFI